MSDQRRVVITGMGVCSAAGRDLQTFWDRLVAGVSCVRRISRFDVTTYPSQIAAEIDDAALRDSIDLSLEWHARGRIAQYAAAASASAIEDAGWTTADLAPHRVGVALAAGMGSYRHDEVFAACGMARSTADSDVDWEAFVATFRATLKPRSAERRTPGSIAALLAHESGFRGPVMGVMTACAGATQAIGDALGWIRSGRADLVIAGGSDSELHPMGLASFCLLGALSCRNTSPTW